MKFPSDSCREFDKLPDVAPLSVHPFPSEVERPTSLLCQQEAYDHPVFQIALPHFRSTPVGTLMLRALSLNCLWERA